MATILQGVGFDQNDITAMSMALDEICKELRDPDGDNPARRVIAALFSPFGRKGNIHRAENYTFALAMLSRVSGKVTD